MDWKLFAQLLVTFAVGVGGWWAGHWLTSRRDIANERRKTITVFLLEAYRRLEKASNRDDSSQEEHHRAIESAIADIQLLGSKNQIFLTEKFADELIGQEASVYEILLDLRATLRQELNLENVEARIKIVRMLNEKSRKQT